MLPVVAIGLLSSLFLFPRTTDRLRGEFIDPEERAGLLREEWITRPRYSFLAEDGTAIDLRARVARPRVGGMALFDATEVTASIVTATGARLEIEAGIAEIDTAGDAARLGGGTVFRTGEGHEIRTEELVAALDRLEIESAGPVEATGPEGRLSAGRLLMRLEGAGPDAIEAVELLVFSGGVKLVYVPQAQ